ncbi:MAG TPA: TlyA family RNA methyltransferase [Candidatus Anoxymicrobiaceae bacterium]
MKKRLDQFLADEGFFDTRARARAAVMEGLVSVDGSNEVKPGTQVKGSENVEVLSFGPEFVSRGGIKLEGALEDLRVDVTDRSALDVGASTGGFTDCLLQRGALRVIALDVGKGQLHWKLRQDDRVTVMEGVNARDLGASSLAYTPDLAIIDVSFISLKKVIGPVTRALAGGSEVIALVKPQFEAGIGRAPKGVVRERATHEEVLCDIVSWLEAAGFTATGVAPSRIRGPKGNVEFFLRIAEGRSRGVTDKELRKAVGSVYGQ